MIEPGHPRLSVVRQCQLASISRSGFYHRPAGETALNLELMRLIDAQFLETPWYGSRQMARHLRREGYAVGRKRIRRLMAKMGLVPIYQRPRTTVPHPEHRVFPYLLRDLVVDRPNQVWCADITYLPMRRGFLYLVAVMDWATRNASSWASRSGSRRSSTCKRRSPARRRRSRWAATRSAPVLLGMSRPPRPCALGVAPFPGNELSRCGKCGAMPERSQETRRSALLQCLLRHLAPPRARTPGARPPRPDGVPGRTGTAGACQTPLRTTAAGVLCLVCDPCGPGVPARHRATRRRSAHWRIHSRRHASWSAAAGHSPGAWGRSARGCGRSASNPMTACRRR